MNASPEINNHYGVGMLCNCNARKKKTTKGEQKLLKDKKTARSSIINTHWHRQRTTDTPTDTAPLKTGCRKDKDKRNQPSNPITPNRKASPTL